MHAYLLDLLECPACHGSMEWTISERRGELQEMADKSLYTQEFRRCRNSQTPLNPTSTSADGSGMSMPAR